ncbi:myosin-3-like isoform X2 [Panicum virgatum]|uniref:myosin-3-like isoform X2 n=1 Tax=Panicum virgatum TaxID=38727 RepID=UPI0019D5B2D6|nr:myosin-3-like isoform X2 [Panicum virgatum]
MKLQEQVAILQKKEHVAMQMKSLQHFDTFVQDIIKQSRRKSQVLEKHAADMNHVAKLEEDLQKQKDLSSRLQMKLDSNAAEYHNEIQKFAEQKDELVRNNKSLHHEKKELQNSIDKWKSTAADWQGAFNREQGAREELEEELKSLRAKMDEAELLKRELVELKQAAEPVAELFEARVAGEEPRLLVERLRGHPGKVFEYAQRLARSISNQVLSFIKSFYPMANLSVVKEGVAADCSDEKFEELMAETAPIAKEMASRIDLR